MTESIDNVQDSMVNSEENEDTPLDLSTTSGIDDLRAAFTPSSEAPKTPEASSSDSDGSAGDEGEGAPEAPAGDGSSDFSEVLKNPQFQAQLRTAQAQLLAQQRALWEQEQTAKQREEEELLLSDEEIGRRQRLQKELEPHLNRFRSEGYAQAQMDFLRSGIGDVWQKVPELKGMDVSERQKFNPTDPKWGSYGEYMEAVINHVANARAEKLATKRAEKLAKAKTSQALDEFRKAQPNPSGVPGAASAPGRIVDVDKMSGKDLLRAAFSG